MATIVQGGPDLRFQALEQGVASGVDNYFAAKRKREIETKFLDAFRLVNQAKSYEEAVQLMSQIDREVLSNPAALEALSGQIQMRFPPQEGVMIDTEEGVRTVAVPKGDVARAIAEAEKRGGRLSTEVEVERDRFGKDLEAQYKAAEFGLKERATAAKERTADAAMLKAKAAGKKANEGVAAKERQIARLVQVLGVPLEEAVKIADGYKALDTVPETGEVRLKDLITGEVINVPIESPSPPQEVPGQPEGGRSLFKAAQGTGPVSQLQEWWAPIGAYTGVGEPSLTVEDRTSLRLASQRLSRALKASDRFPVTELERIKKEFSVEPKIWDQRKVMQRRMIALHRTLDLWIAQAERDAEDQSLPQKVRENAKTVVPEMRNFQAQMAIPRERLENLESEALAVPVEFEAHFSRREWNALSQETRDRLMQTLGR